METKTFDEGYFSGDYLRLAKQDRVTIELFSLLRGSQWQLHMTFGGEVVGAAPEAITTGSDTIPILPDIELPPNSKYPSRGPRGFHQRPFWVETDDGSQRDLLRFRISPDVSVIDHAA